MFTPLVIPCLLFYPNTHMLLFIYALNHCSLQIYSRLHFLMGDQRPDSGNRTWLLLPLHTQCDSASPHAAPVCTGGTGSKLGGILLGHHTDLYLVSKLLRYTPHKVPWRGAYTYVKHEIDLMWLLTDPVVFCSCSLAGVCMLAFHQAQHILSNFSTPSSRANHNSAPRENSSVNHSSSNGIR